MKAQIYLLATLLIAALAFVGCGKEKTPKVDNAAKVVGECLREPFPKQK